MSNWRNILLICLVCIFIIVGCECVPGIDTPKEVTPNFDSHVMFINAIPEFATVNVISDNTQLVNDLLYVTDTNIYVNVPPGSRNIKLANWNDSVLFNTLVDLSDLKNYTFIAYADNVNRRILSSVYGDSIQNYIATNSYYRCIHVSPDFPQASPLAKFKITGQNDTSLGFKKFTPFKPAYSGKFKIEVTDPMTDSALVTPKINVVFEAGKGYTILLKGYYGGIGKKALTCDVIESTIYTPK